VKSLTSFHSFHFFHLKYSIKQLIHIYKLNLKESVLNDEIIWLTKEEMDSSPISTQMKKVFAQTQKKRKKNEPFKQRKIKDFF
jgi:hypothetical protein